MQNVRHAQIRQGRPAGPYQHRLSGISSDDNPAIITLSPVSTAPRVERPSTGSFVKVVTLSELPPVPVLLSEH